MKLIVENVSQDIAIGGHSADELTLTKEEAVKLATVLLSAWSGKTWADVELEMAEAKEAIDLFECDNDELEAA